MSDSIRLELTKEKLNRVVRCLTANIDAFKTHLPGIKKDEDFNIFCEIAEELKEILESHSEKRYALVFKPYFKNKEDAVRYRNKYDEELQEFPELGELTVIEKTW